MQAGRLQIRTIPRVGLPGTGARCVNMFVGMDRPLTFFSNGMPLPSFKSRCGRGRWTGTRGGPVLARVQLQSSIDGQDMVSRILAVQIDVWC